MSRRELSIGIHYCRKIYTFYFGHILVKGGTLTSKIQKKNSIISTAGYTMITFLITLCKKF